jgi:hypothetical protein
LSDKRVQVSSFRQDSDLSSLDMFGISIPCFFSCAFLTSIIIFSF